MESGSKLKVEEGGQQPQSQSVRLLVEYPSNVYAYFSMKRQTRFERLMNRVCRQNNISIHAGLRFHWDGQRIQAGQLWKYSSQSAFSLVICLCFCGDFLSPGVGYRYLKG